MFPENLEALYELQLSVQEFTDSYVYIKGYNKCTVERIQHMYMNTYRVNIINYSIITVINCILYRLYYREINYYKIHAVHLQNMINF